MKMARPFRAACVLSLAAFTSIATAQAGDSDRKINPRFALDGLLVLITEGLGVPGSGPTPVDLFDAAGVTFEPFPTFAPGELIGFARLNPDTTFGRAFHVIQNFDFGPQSPWSLRNLQPNYITCGIPEGCPGVLEVSRVFNFSARAEVRTGEGVTIGGMVIPGEFPRLVVFKVRGPSLHQFGIDVALTNPQMRLHQGDEAILMGDDWGTLRDWEKDLARSVCPPPDDPREAMIVTFLDPGIYTAVVMGVDGGTGIALLEMYLVDAFMVE